MKLFTAHMLQQRNVKAEIVLLPLYLTSCHHAGRTNWHTWPSF